MSPGRGLKMMAGDINSRTGGGLVPTCRSCQRSGFLLRLDSNGLCGPCEVQLDFKVANASRIIADSIPIIEEGKNIATRLSRCDLVLEHAEGLLPYERMGIATLTTPPSQIISRVRWAEAEIAKMQPARREGASSTGRSYVDLVDPIKAARAGGHTEEAERLLLQAISDTERESKRQGWGVAPWHYEQLAILYRKEKRFTDEVALLERYSAMPHAPGVTPAKLKERLRRARELAVAKAQYDRSQGNSDGVRA